jgi:hypothetical protein
MVLYRVPRISIFLFLPSLSGGADLGAHSPAAEGTHWGMGGARMNGLIGDRTRKSPFHPCISFFSPRTISLLKPNSLALLLV